MKLIEKEKTIAKTFELDFEIEKSGWYAISVSAKVKSEKQRGKGITDDEDLRIEIDGQKFPKLDNSERYLDSPAAFSGGQQKDALKIVYFVLHLVDAGKHILSFVADEEARLADVGINPLPNFPEVAFDLNLKSEKRNRSPWITFAFAGIGIQSFVARAVANWRFPDGDDLKIIVDGKIKKNNFSILHRNWIFASSILKKIFGKETDEKTFEENLPIANLHYVEIWADETPTLEKISFSLSSPESLPAKTVKQYEPGSNGENYNRFDVEIKKWVDDWNDKFSKQKFPPIELLDPNLVKAIIYVESRMGYGSSPTGHSAFPDVMQAADPRNPAVHTLNNDGWIDPNTGKEAGEYEWINDGLEILNYKGEAKVDSAEDSIRWGTRWLYHKAQGVLKEGGRYWRSWEQAVVDYNQRDNWEYQKEVYKIYKEGVDRSGYNLWTLAVGLLASATLVAGLFFYQSKQNKFYAYRESVKGMHDFDFYVKTLDGLRWKKFFLGRHYDDGRDFDIFYDEKIFANFWTPLNEGEKLLAVSGKDIADDRMTAMVSYKNGEFRLLPKLDEYGTLEKTFNADQISIENLDDDPEEEIIEDHFLRYDNADDQIWKRYYDFDRSAGVYRFVKETKMPVWQSRTEKISKI